MPNTSVAINAGADIYEYTLSPYAIENKNASAGTFAQNINATIATPWSNIDIVIVFSVPILSNNAPPETFPIKQNAANTEPKVPTNVALNPNSPVKSVAYCVLNADIETAIIAYPIENNQKYLFCLVALAPRPSNPLVWTSSASFSSTTSTSPTFGNLTNIITIGKLQTNAKTPKNI